MRSIQFLAVVLWVCFTCQYSGEGVPECYININKQTKNSEHFKLTPRTHVKCTCFSLVYERCPDLIWFISLHYPSQTIKPRSDWLGMHFWDTGKRQVCTNSGISVHSALWYSTSPTSKTSIPYVLTWLRNTEYQERPYQTTLTLLKAS